MKVSKIRIFNGETTLIYFIDELYSPFDIFLDRILRNQHRVFDLLVIKEGLLEVSVSLAPLLLHLQPHACHPKIPLRKEFQHILIAINDAEYLGNPS